MRNSRLLFAACVGVSLCVSAGIAHAQSFTAGNVVIYRVGSASSNETLSNLGNTVFLDEYTASGALVQSKQLSGLVASGTATSEGLITLSQDGKYITATGYASAGATSIVASNAATNNRVVQIYDATTGSLLSSTGFSDYASANNPRSAVTTNGTDIYFAGAAGGVRYAQANGGTNQTSTQLSTTVTNIRQVNVFNGQLFASSSSGAFRLSTVGTGTPTTSGQTITNLPGFPTSGGSPYGFFFADLNSSISFNNTGYDTAYVADDSTTGGGILKYTFDGTNWSSSGSFTASLARGLTGYVTNGTVQLFATTGGSTTTGGGSLYSVSDSSGYGTAVSGSATAVKILASATDGNSAFRGIVYLPGIAGSATPEPGTFALVGFGLLPLGGTLLRKRRNAKK